MLAIPQVWWLRPVSSAARVGEQRAVVWKWLYLSPRLATRSKFGVGIGPPKVLVAPKPVSSVMMSRTFGAPLGAVTPVGKLGLDSLALRPMTPPNGSSGTGRTGEPLFCDFSTGLSWAKRLARGPRKATSHPNRAMSERTSALNRVFMVLLLLSAGPCRGLQ